MKEFPDLKKSSERQRITLAAAPQLGGSPPLPPEPPRPSRLGAILRRLSAWALRPRTLLVVGLLMAASFAWVIAARLRPPTIEGPALPRDGWRAISGEGPGGFSKKTVLDQTDPGAALDGDEGTNWTTKRRQSNTQWFAVDMGQPRSFHQLVLDSGSFIHDYPRGYAVFLSSDGVRWGSAIASGEGSQPLTIVNLGPQCARYLKIVQTGQDKSHWSICELNVYEK